MVLDEHFGLSAERFLDSCDKRARSALSLFTREEACRLMRLAGRGETSAYKAVAADPRAMLRIERETVWDLIARAREPR